VESGKSGIFAGMANKTAPPGMPRGLQLSVKDEYHRGQYKLTPNHVIPYDQEGKEISAIFETTPPFQTPLEMQQLVEWTNQAFGVLPTVELWHASPLQVDNDNGIGDAFRTGRKEAIGRLAGGLGHDRDGVSRSAGAISL
jgi:hypothetical protein